MAPRNQHEESNETAVNSSPQHSSKMKHLRYDTINKEEQPQQTAKQQKSQHDKRKHTKSTIALCLVMLTNSCLQISVFPYSGYMAIHLIPNANEENTGRYAGLIASFYMTGRIFSSFLWGRVADAYGRTFVMIISSALCAIFSILFGLSTSFTSALVFRFLCGVSSGTMGPVKTSVSELSKGNQDLENKTMSLVIGMWGWGFLIFPALSGALAEPVKQYPHLFQGGGGGGGDLEEFLEKYPFVLPNLVVFFFCVVSLVGATFCVEETLPLEQRRSVKFILSDLVHWFRGIFSSIIASRFQRAHKKDYEDGMALPLCSSQVKQSDKVSYDAIETCDTSSDNNQQVEEDEVLKLAKVRNIDSCSALHSMDTSSISSPSQSKKFSTAKNNECQPNTTKTTTTTQPPATLPPATLSSLWHRKNTRQHLLTYFFFSFFTAGVDEAFPLFCISKDIGLGIAEISIGKILSLSGILFALLNYIVSSTIISKCGLYKSLHMAPFLSSPIIFLVPLSILINQYYDSYNNDNNNLTNGDNLSWPTAIYLSFIMSWNRIFAMVFYAGITIATNRTVHVSHRATMNGLSMMGGSIFKAMGPTFAGFLVAFSASSGVIDSDVGSVVVFGLLGLIGLSIGFFSLLYLREEEVEDLEER
uniref:Major facilitator superfamily (MFS) profile domain-containing protein n=1 Tax=Ditylum brightwellii TaxID=49249 RepID=A0A7S4RB85_9STRA